MEILRTRVLRSSTRKESSPYKIDTSNVSANDILNVCITHESEPLELLFQFKGDEIAGKSSIHFKAVKQNGEWKINWSGIAPLSNFQTKDATIKPSIEFFEGKLRIKSFPPIADESSCILLLGTMPGDRSLEMNEYYAHKRNQFWKIMFEILGKPFSIDYSERTNLLLKNRIALWDVLSHCEREGASDSKIENEVPNDFESFYETHQKVRHVFLTSKKAENFYNKYIGKNNQRKYYLLPSPSRANTWKTSDQKLKEWGVILETLNNG